jgi:DNA helicase-2/ATP-dependent DNA helicase PcrA
MGSDATPSRESDALLVGLDPAQRHAVTTDAAPLCIVAGAGSGKTRVLTRRIAWRAATGREDPRRVLALTFTRGAATELSVRLRALGVRDAVRAGTFHAVAWAELRDRWASEGRPAPTLLERPVRLLARVVEADRPTLAGIASELAWARARLVDPADYPAAAARTGRRPPIEPWRMSDVALDYEREKRRRGMVDFDDLLELLVAAIDRDPELAAAQRWRFEHLYVDEVQDLNPLQLRLLEAWRGGRPTLCCVGDPNQAIYAWNGADPSLIERFDERVRDATVVAIDTSYRSSPQILSLANAVLDAGRLGGVRLRATHPEGPVPLVHRFPDDEAEAVGVARAVLDAHLPGAPWSHQAVLARTNAQLDPVAAALEAVGVPIRRDGRGRFTELPPVRAALRELGTTGNDLAEAVARLTAAADDGNAEADDVRALARLAELADEYRRIDPRADAAGFRSWLIANRDELDGGDAVAVRTFHGAKGLEWPLVHVIGVEAGLVPLARATTPEAEAEERRLFYVAVTRAERTLRLSWAATRRFGGSEPMARRPSPYLAEVAPVLHELVDAARPVDGRAHLAAMRAVLAARRSAPE